MPTCSFCKKNYENPRGLTVFTFDGKSVFYCSSKCRNNAGLGRDPKKTNWVKSEKKVKVVSENVGKSKKETKDRSVVGDESKSVDVTDNRTKKPKEKVETEKTESKEKETKKDSE